MNKRNSIIVAVVITFFVTIILICAIMMFVVYEFKNKHTGNGGGNNIDGCPKTVSGVWYTKSNNFGVTAVVSIAKATDPDSGDYSTITIEDVDYTMQGSIMLQGLNFGNYDSNFFCGDCYFVLDDDCNMSFYSKCLSNWAGTDSSVFDGWTYNSDSNSIDTGRGTLIPIGDDIFPVYEDDG